jgi:hypothetical protein
MPDFRYGLGRVPSKSHDGAHSVDQLLSMIDAGSAVPVTWVDPVVLDQGQTPHCVGFGCAGFIACAEAGAAADPTVTNATGDAIYAAAKVIDGEPDAQDGSSVHTGAQVLKNMRVIDAYAFGTMAQAKAWIEQHGPVVIGTRWDYGMEQPDASGYVHPDGNSAGGHCTLLHGQVSPQPGATALDNRGRNSWGRGWGLDGDYLITDGDLANISAADGEFMMAVKFTKPAPPAPTPTPPIPTPPACDRRTILCWLEAAEAWVKHLKSLL